MNSMLPGDDIVGMVPMCHLNYRDEVQTLSTSTRTLDFTLVYLFDHRDPGTVSSFISLRTECNTIELSPTHYYLGVIPASEVDQWMANIWKISKI
jgi:hypothetical protein